MTLLIIRLLFINNSFNIWLDGEPKGFHKTIPSYHHFGHMSPTSMKQLKYIQALDKDADKIETLWDSSGLLDYDLWDVKRITRHRIRKGKVQLYCEFDNIMTNLQMNYFNI